MSVAKIAEVTFTSADRIRDVIHNFNTDGFRLALPEVQGWAPEDLHAPRAPGDQEDRQPRP
ncbi:helix-turn-helix domain-containing protein [Streptomyces pseudovenezuelae]|uniref:Helix-turn-helix domain-containing protein n=1 Tax=Streptomyces pseudovenezuelae TaxID=67350 RepID=A0ABZ1XA63_9ACTN|nr:helix-turn-helix domain-containing protein [Streptomyces pseudovenezuelae]